MNKYQVAQKRIKSYFYPWIAINQLIDVVSRSIPDDQVQIKNLYHYVDLNRRLLYYIFYYYIIIRYYIALYILHSLFICSCIYFYTPWAILHQKQQNSSRKWGTFNFRSNKSHHLLPGSTKIFSLRVYLNKKAVSAFKLKIEQFIFTFGRIWNRWLAVGY